MTFCNVGLYSQYSYSHYTRCFMIRSFVHMANRYGAVGKSQLRNLGYDYLAYLVSRTVLAARIDLDCSHYDPLIATTALLLDHLTLWAELLQDAFGVAALVGVGVVVAHCDRMA